MTSPSHDVVKAFWDSRAREFGADPSATLTDNHMRLLEIRTMSRYIGRLRPSTVLDVGCGNGFSTMLFADAHPRVQFTGIDYSPEMIEHACSRQSGNVRFAVGDVLEPTTLPRGMDVVLTQRCIQNVLDPVLQRQAIRNLLALLNPGGSLLLMECSQTGLAGYNRVSQAVSRRRQLKKPPFHNLWFDDAELRRDFGATVDCFCSTYMLCKAIHSRLRPLGAWLPQVGSFGYDRLYVIRPGT